MCEDKEDLLSSFLDQIDQIDDGSELEARPAVDGPEGFDEAALDSNEHGGGQTLSPDGAHVEHLARGMVVLRSFCSEAEQQMLADWFPPTHSHGKPGR